MFIQLLLVILAIYLVLGFLFGVLFIAWGIGKVDEGAHGSTIGFRIIILPGISVFWPFLLKKWLNANKETRND